MPVAIKVLQTTGTGYGRRGAYSGISVCSTLIWGESRVRQDGLQVRAWQEDMAVVRKRSRTLKLKISYNIHKAKI